MTRFKFGGAAPHPQPLPTGERGGDKPERVRPMPQSAPSPLWGGMGWGALAKEATP